MGLAHPHHLAIVILLGLFASCRPSAHSQEKSTMECSNAIELFDHQQFSQWHGLSEDCTPSWIATHAGGDLRQANTHWLGEKKQPASFLGLKFQGYDEVVRLWFRGDKTVILEAKYPALKDVKSLLAHLATPTAKLDYYFGVVRNQQGEYVYPDRGITLFMNTGRDNVVKIWVYAPMDLQAYMDEIHYLEPPREQPTAEE
jgi:hypothetical protein